MVVGIGWRDCQFMVFHLWYVSKGLCAAVLCAGGEGTGSGLEVGIGRGCIT